MRKRPCHECTDGHSEPTLPFPFSLLFTHPLAVAVVPASSGAIPWTLNHCTVADHVNVTHVSKGFQLEPDTTAWGNVLFSQSYLHTYRLDNTNFGGMSLGAEIDFNAEKQSYFFTIENKGSHPFKMPLLYAFHFVDNSSVFYLWLTGIYRCRATLGNSDAAFLDPSSHPFEKVTVHRLV